MVPSLVLCAVGLSGLTQSVLIVLTLIPACLLPRRASGPVVPKGDPAEAPVMMH